MVKTADLCGEFDAEIWIAILSILLIGNIFDE